MTDTALVGRFKAVYDLAHSLLKERDARIIGEKVVELNAIILAAQNDALAANASQAALIEEKRKLEKRIIGLEAQIAEKDRYDLYQPARGQFVYMLKPDAHPPEPPHWRCAPCHDKGVKSILQLDKDTATVSQYKCPQCSNTINVPLHPRTFRAKFLAEADS